MSEKRFKIIICKDSGETKGEVIHPALTMKEAEEMAKKITNEGEYYLVIEKSE
jgi:hypothetical protein